MELPLGTKQDEASPQMDMPASKTRPLPVPSHSSRVQGETAVGQEDGWGYAPVLHFLTGYGMFYFQNSLLCMQLTRCTAVS